MINEEGKKRVEKLRKEWVITNEEKKLIPRTFTREELIDFSYDMIASLILEFAAETEEITDGEIDGLREDISHYIDENF